MQFTAVALLSLVAVSFASPIQLTGRLHDLVARSPQVDAEVAAMTDASGNVVAFDSTGVYLAAAATSQ